MGQNAKKKNGGKVGEDHKHELRSWPPDLAGSALHPCQHRGNPEINMEGLNTGPTTQTFVVKVRCRVALHSLRKRKHHAGKEVYLKNRHTYICSLQKKKKTWMKEKHGGETFYAFSADSSGAALHIRSKQTMLLFFFSFLGVLQQLAFFSCITAPFWSLNLPCFQL